MNHEHLLNQDYLASQEDQLDLENLLFLGIPFDLGFQKRLVHLDHHVGL